MGGSFSSGGRSSVILTAIAVIFTMLLFRNIASKDYKSETKSYLKSVGKEDAIDRVIPKTKEVNTVYLVR